MDYLCFLAQLSASCRDLRDNIVVEDFCTKLVTGSNNVNCKAESTTASAEENETSLVLI